MIDVVEVNNTLGECVLWNDRQQKAWWTDIQESTLFQYDPIQRSLKSYALPERLGSFGFTEDDNTLICAFASGFALYNPASTHIEWLARPDVHLSSSRFNDGRVDRQGRFWAGTMNENDPATVDARGSLYCLSRTECRRVFSDIGIPNSLCWSPDSSRFYFADSTTHTIQCFEFDPATGSTRQPRQFAQITPPSAPDGSTIHAEGCLWNAQWSGSKIVRYDAAGAVLDELPLPVSQPTCVAFGGAQMNRLFVTSARAGLTAEQLAKEPHAGNLFIYHTPCSGLTESRFRV